MPDTVAAFGFPPDFPLADLAVVAAVIRNRRIDDKRATAEACWRVQGYALGLAFPAGSAAPAGWHLLRSEHGRGHLPDDQLADLMERHVDAESDADASGPHRVGMLPPLPWAAILRAIVLDVLPLIIKAI